MKSRHIFLFSSILIMSILFFSCTNEDVYSDSTESKVDIEINTDELDQSFIQNNRAINTRLVLGDKRINPFSITNINIANEILYDGKESSKTSTHKYVKFYQIFKII